MLISEAWGVKTYQVTGPEWRDSERYEITGVLPEGKTRDQAKFMLQNLLADRFEIRTDATRLIRNMRWMCARRRGSFELWISKPRIPDVLNVLVLERADRVN